MRISYADVLLAATGGVPPYSWSISAGALPGGLSLSGGGTVSGVPTTPGTFSFTVSVSDSANSLAAAGASISVAPYLTGYGACAGACQVEQGCVTVCGTYVKSVGGVAPFSAKVSALPPGTTAGWPSLGGTFTTVGTYGFSVTVYDSLGATMTLDSSFNVFPHIGVKLGTLPTGYVNLAYTASSAYYGGSGTPAVELLKGSLPPGLSVAVDPKTGTVVIFGTPTTTGTYAFVLRLYDMSPCGSGYNCYIDTPALTINVLLG